MSTHQRMQMYIQWEGKGPRFGGNVPDLLKLCEANFCCHRVQHPTFILETFPAYTHKYKYSSFSRSFSRSISGTFNGIIIIPN